MGRGTKGFVAVAAAVAAALLVPNVPAGAGPAVSDGTGPLDTPEDLAAALAFEAQVPEHTFGGMVVPLIYDAWPHLDPDAQPVRWDGEADSGNYTGVYLAAQSLRYDQAVRELEALGPDGDPTAVAFWTAQRDEAAARSEEIVRYYHVLVNIASVWDTELSLEHLINFDLAPTDVGFIDFGGGIIPGEAGLLMRTCNPDPGFETFADVRHNNRPPHVIGPLRWEGQDWYCLGYTSRDSYAGTVFGMSVALDHLTGPEHAELRVMLARDLMAIADYAIKYLWFQPRPHGRIAIPIVQNDLQGPISPLFIQVPAARLHILQTARHAAEVLGATSKKLWYDLLWAEEYVTAVASSWLLDSMIVDATNPHDAYYKFQLNLMCLFNMIRLEPDPNVREAFRLALAAQDATTHRHGNAFFEALTYALTGDPARLADAVDLHRQWLEYDAFHKEVARLAVEEGIGSTPFLHTPRCHLSGPVDPDAPISEQPLDCVPRNRVEMDLFLPLLGTVTVPINPGSGDELRSVDPLPVGVRRLADFLWQKDPTIVGGDHDVPWRGPSIDFLATYWIIRYYSEVAPPAYDPLPAWAGPRFR